MDGSLCGLELVGGVGDHVMGTLDTEGAGTPLSVGAGAFIGDVGRTGLATDRPVKGAEAAVEGFLDDEMQG